MTQFPGKLTLVDKWKPLPILFFGIAAIWFSYSLSFPGIFLFDDAPNLERLELIDDVSAQLSFIFSGEAGPLGRSLSLATFVVQKQAWPNHPEAMLEVNIAIHLLTVIVVFLLTLGLARIRFTSEYAGWVAAATAILWGLSPFLATTHLMIIQRMTSLAGLLVFLGLAGFTWAHLLATSRPVIARFLLIFGLGLGTLLAALAKESGALLPLLALIILWLWIPKAQRLQGRIERSIILVLAVIPTLLLLGYLTIHSIQIFESGYGAHRGFTPGQRLLTQTWILLDYVQNLLIPRSLNVSPFTDGVSHATGWLNPPITLASLIIWIILIGLAIRFHRTAAYMLFGIIFFLGAHLVESTTIGLELYFAHRNYVGSFGIYFAIICGVAHFPRRYLATGFIALSIYAALFFAVLAQANLQWSHFGITAEMWVVSNPKSIRAAQFLASQYLRLDDPLTAHKILDKASENNPNDAMLLLQSTLFCRGRENEFPEDLAILKSRLRDVPLDRQAIAEMVNISRRDLKLYCSELKHEDLADIANVLLTNPVYTESSYAKSHLFLAKGFAAAEQDQLAQATEFFVQAYETLPHLDTAFTASSMMSNAGEHDQAISFLQGVRQHAPTNPIKSLIWQQRVDAFEYLIEKSRVIDESKKVNAVSNHQLE